MTAGDVRGVERDTRARRRASRSTRQQLSQWDRGAHEALIGWKTGVDLGHISEAHLVQNLSRVPDTQPPFGAAIPVP